MNILIQFFLISHFLYYVVHFCVVHVLCIIVLISPFYLPVQVDKLGSPIVLHGLL